jgi:hypothetical protein
MLFNEKGPTNPVRDPVPLRLSFRRLDPEIAMQIRIPVTQHDDELIGGSMEIWTPKRSEKNK